MIYAKITSKGQITIPKSVRDHLDLKPGDRIEFRKGPGGSKVFFIPSKVTVEEVFGFLGKIKKPKKALSVEEMDQSIIKYLKKKHG